MYCIVLYCGRGSIDSKPGTSFRRVPVSSAFGETLHQQFRSSIGLSNSQRHPANQNRRHIAYMHMYTYGEFIQNVQYIHSLGALQISAQSNLWHEADRRQSEAPSLLFTIDYHLPRR
jgi:hypothetical protein